ncbi:sulfurtransferase complex subunit TusB [Chromohalobacter sp. 296-RDG]|uniref:sulfurtransferase complex subunit TusB n=1 Tax=Chromohalobacter sp. 296-RDG TaxID=2994062 RepID=UPI00246918E6|nr:sulfurtransferase complex subunit TusB [Chromohalobacter sp. 296-RDG]
MLLHLLNRAPSSSSVHQDVLRAMREEDGLMLIEDGVFGAVSAQVQHFPGLEGRLFALREDLESRGLAGRCDARVIIVDMDGFVALTEDAQRTVSWF